MNPLATQLVDALRATGQRLVCAESCTCGALAAALGEIPGVSEFFCGSAVTYQEATKEAWLAVSEESLRDFSAVSEQVAREMAWGVLNSTPQATWSLSTTGYLGPESPQRQDGLVFIGLANRGVIGASRVTVFRLQLHCKGRVDRRAEVVSRALRVLEEGIRLGDPRQVGQESVV